MQGILCAADTALEPPDLLAQGSNGGDTVTGYHVEHQCRSWDELRDFVDKNAAV
jgi:hypothetical protein